MSGDTTSNNKAWLQKLKDESWEAELLVSAVATFSAFQLFSVIEWLTNKFIDVLLPSHYMFGYFIVYSGLLAISVLVAMFVIHFVLRSYWVGLVGLNSVFPEYGMEDSMYSKIYTEKLLNELPELKTSIEKVDELCSVIFSSAFAVMMIYSFIALMFGFILIIYSLLSQYIPFVAVLIILCAFAAVLVAQILVSAFANLERNKDKEGLQNLHFKFVKFTSMALLGPFYRANMQITMTFGSNYKKNKSLSKLLLSFIFAGMALSIFKIFDTNVFYMLDNTRYQNESYAYAAFYKNTQSQNAFLMTPQIQSDAIYGESIELFIPVFSHESRLLETAACEDFDAPDDVSKLQRRTGSGFALLACYKTYHTIMINGEELDVQFINYRQADTSQKGIKAFISQAYFKEGLNELVIQKRFPDSEANWRILFFYTPQSN
ncbi:hypothetical protein KJ365_05600 [Glaciecola sp. XM2]|uniref:hypothetical protein n=1 Tax=Glaciecola sp. XM2 TaxID=1914931 RepID=UPI001BDF0DB0|nr:hypothetical protein [Glaciecola sp. XM2]MBT1450349.1 hypothetical protein [Glaciecola sp. XM2]